jgi:hypothetical protein
MYFQVRPHLRMHSEQDVLAATVGISGMLTPNHHPNG